MKITKAELIEVVFKNHEGLTKSDATDAVEAILSIAKNCLIGGADLMLSGFGKFKVKDKRTRRGRNPVTGDTLILEARRVVTFTPSNLLRKKVNNDEGK